jgi:hypothetical protein
MNDEIRNTPEENVPSFQIKPFCLVLQQLQQYEDLGEKRWFAMCDAEVLFFR